MPHTRRRVTAAVSLGVVACADFWEVLGLIVDDEDPVVSSDGFAGEGEVRYVMRAELFEDVSGAGVEAGDIDVGAEVGRFEVEGDFACFRGVDHYVTITFDGLEMGAGFGVLACD